MPNRLLVIPFSGDPDLVSFLKEQDIDPPDEVGHRATVELVQSILSEVQWPYEARLVTGAWEAFFMATDGLRPPISEVSLGENGTLDFRIGPLYGPWHLSREVARRCGPQVAVRSSGSATCLVTGCTEYADFHRAVAGGPPPTDGSDREWHPSAEDGRTAPGNATLSHPLRTPERALDRALAGDPGHEQAAMQVGRALQAFRWSGPPSQELTLDRERYLAIVERLRGYVRGTRIPAPELVWALGQAEHTRDDLAALVRRLEGVAGAAETVAMARVFLRS